MSRPRTQLAASPLAAGERCRHQTLAVRLLVWLVFYCALGCWLVAVSQASVLARAPREGVLSGELVVPAMQPLVAAQQVQGAEAVLRASPFALAAREASKTAYAGLGAAAAARLARAAFPAVMDEPAGGLPRLAAGESVVGFPSDDSAVVRLAGGKRALIESTAPLALETSREHRSPIDLAIAAAGGSFRPVFSPVGVRIARSAGGGAELTRSGVSLLPVDRAGRALVGTQGQLDGAAVFYGGTGTDMDSLVKPTVDGFEESTVLRSVQSPEELFFRVAMPPGARLARAANGSGAVEVVDEGVKLATIAAPTGEDATGLPVAVSMSASGDLLALSVAHRSPLITYPVLVDPQVTEGLYGYEQGYLAGTASHPTNWRFVRIPESAPITAGGFGEGGALTLSSGGYSANESGLLVYPMQKGSEARIRSVMLEFKGTDTSPVHLETVFALVKPSEEREPEGRVWVNEGSFPRESPRILPEGTEGTPGNAAEFGVYTTGSGGGFSYTVYKAQVEITQEHQPTVKANTSAATIDGRENVLYGHQEDLWPEHPSRGGHGWLSPTNGVIELEAHDPGIGVSSASLSYTESWGAFPLKEGDCQGDQCNENLVVPIFYHSGMPDGEYPMGLQVADAMWFTTAGSWVGVKVDGTPPHDLEVSGLPSGGDIGEQPYHLRASAVDGSGDTPSSGVKSITLSVDGQEVSGAPSGSCEPGPCQASGEWTINGEDLPAGKNTLTETATDYAGNVESKSYEIYVRHATPVAVGPGSVNPITGNFTLNATDVAVSDPTGSLTVSRSYNSRKPDAGAGGPLGPQWSLSVGAQERLEVLPDTSVMLVGEAGTTHFTRKETSETRGVFESPQGDANVTLEEAREAGKAKEFLLRDPAQDTTTAFTLPSGSAPGSPWLPTIEEGPVPTDTTTGAYKTVEVEGKTIVEPTKELGPVPAKVSCSPELKPGCRALSFTYANETTATGDSESEWGEYKGRLAKISFTAYDPSHKEMATSVVAQYKYDSDGRLRAEWDPRISPALVTSYGYDEEGHLTAVSPPGQQPWLLHYGTIPGEPDTGRLLSVSRPAASTALGNGKPPAKGKAKLSGKALVGNTLGVSTSKWKGALSYGYQWQRCASASSCAAIAGAVNPTYTVQPADAGYRLRVEVTATDAFGSSTAAGTESKTVAENMPAYVRTFAEKGTGVGQLERPGEMAVDPSGDLWVTDQGNERLDEFNPEGKEPRTYSTPGTGIAINQRTGNIYVSNDGLRSVVELNPKGEEIRKFEVPPGVEAMSPTALAIDAAGDVWVADPSHERVVEFSEEGQFVGTVTGESGPSNLREPASIAFSGEVMYVAEKEDIKEYEATGSHRYLGRLGSVKGPWITTEPVSGDLYVSNAGVELYAPNGAFLGSLSLRSESTAISATGDVYTLAGDAVEEYTPGYTNSNPPPAPPQVVGSAVSTIEYGVPLSGTGLPTMTKEEVERWGQKTDLPVEAMAIFPADEPMGWPAQNYRRATLVYLDAYGRQVNVASPGGAIATSEYNEDNDVVRSLSADDRAAALEEGAQSAAAAERLSTKSTYNKEGNQLLETLGPERLIKLSEKTAKHEAGSEVQARSRTVYAYDEGAPATGGPYNLPTKVTQDAVLAGGEEAETRETTTSYSGPGNQENLGWKLRKPISVTSNPKGLKLTHTVVYEPPNGDEPSSGQVIETRTPAGASEPSNPSAHDSKTVYYSAGENVAYQACGEHPAWAGLVCETLPAQQPETKGLPRLPETTVTYNMWEEPETTTEKFGASERTETLSYDAAGRTLTSEVTASEGTTLPEVTYKYNTTNGALEEEKTSTKSAIKSVLNTLGQIAEYTDANGDVSTYSYDIDGRPAQVNNGKGIQTYHYDETTGWLTKLEDSTAGTFRASYDPEGNLLSERLPSGLTANYTYNPVGEASAVEYAKGASTLYSDSVVPSIYGQWLSQHSSLSSENYAYDAIGRLTQVQETPAGKGCITRIYQYDEETNRTSVTTRKPTPQNTCATSGGTIETHSYDQANRLTDTGTTYNAFGDITKLPAKDADGYELTSSFYADNQLQSQSQEVETPGGQKGTETIEYQLDPAGRTSEIDSTGPTVAAETNQYSGPGSTPAWTATLDGEWTRYITGIGNGLKAIQHGTEEPMLQISNLHGDIVATAKDNEAATGLASTIGEPNEYGMPATEAPPKDAWLGADELRTELPSGVVAMGARSYVPEIGRFLQPDPLSGGSANAYAYTHGDPLNETDPSGEWTFGTPAWLAAFEGEYTAGGQAREEARELAARLAREKYEREQAAYREAEAVAEAAKAETEAEEAAAAGDMPDPEDLMEEGWWEEEGEYEYASYHPHGENGKGATHIEPAVLYQPLEPEADRESNAGEGAGSLVVPLCKEDSTGPCARTVEASAKHCADGEAGPAECRKYWAHHRKGAGALGRCVKGAVAGGAGGAAGGATAGGPDGAAAGAVAGAVSGCVTGVLSG